MKKLIAITAILLLPACAAPRGGSVVYYSGGFGYDGHNDAGFSQLEMNRKINRIEQLQRIDRLNRL